MSTKKEFKFFVNVYHDTFEKAWEMHIERSRSGAIWNSLEEIFSCAVNDLHSKFIEERDAKGGTKNECSN